LTTQLEPYQELEITTPMLEFWFLCQEKTTTQTLCLTFIARSKQHAPLLQVKAQTLVTTPLWVVETATLRVALGLHFLPQVVKLLQAEQFAFTDTGTNHEQTTYSN
jgi:hypothetical protein